MVYILGGVDFFRWGLAPLETLPRWRHVEITLLQNHSDPLHPGVSSLS